MEQERTYAYDLNSGEYVYRIPGHRHGDGQVDSEDSPVWLLATQEEAEAACGGNVPDVKLSDD